MISIKDFNKTEMHDKILLVRTNNDNMYRYALAQYDALNDVFYILKAPFMNNTEQPLENMAAYGATPYDEVTVKGLKTGTRVQCVMPKSFCVPAGSGVITSFMLLGEALDSMEVKNLCREDVYEVLKNAKNFDQYLVVTKSSRLCVSYIGIYADGKNEQFTMVTPDVADHKVYHAHGIMPVNMISYAVNLAEWESQYASRLADVDELYEDISKLDLDYMSQADVMECIHDCMERHLRNRRITK